MTTKLPSAIIELDDFTESINIMVYGNSGVGKTVLGGTAERGLIVAAEQGTISAKRQGSTAKVWPVSSWTDFVAAYDWVAANPDAFDWVIIDSLTEVQQKLLRDILDRAVADNPARDPDIPAIQDHQKWQNQLKRYISLWNELPVNVMWTAQAMHKEDAEGEDICLPLILGKQYEISAWVCAQMGVVAYMKVKRVKGEGDEKTTLVRQIQCKTIPPYFGKDRYDALGSYVREPTIPMLEKMIGNDKPVAKKAVASTGPKPPAKKATAAKKVAAPVEVIEDDDVDDDEDEE